MQARTFLDHIAIAAFSLEDGIAFVRDTLGVTPQAGGDHPRMGTHNWLLRLGNNLYLEVIAPNPAVPAPARRRWFDLDRLRPGSTPRLASWVARTTDIHEAVAAASEPLGSIEPMNRGTLDWLITIPDDGSLPLDGAAPALIEWRAGAHPAARMEDKGVSLTRLEVRHSEPERISRLLRSLAFDGPVVVTPAVGDEAPRLTAYLDTPAGPRIIGN